MNPFTIMEAAGRIGFAGLNQPHAQAGAHVWTFTLPREMTAGDLGLSCACDRLGCLECGERWRTRHNPKPDAPYAFWLGAGT